MQRLFKQLFFSTLFLAIIGGIGYLFLFRIFLPPSCTGVACELKLLAPPAVEHVVYFPNVNKNTIDLAAEVKNPNLSWGVADIPYQFILLGLDGNVLTRVNGSTFLLPGESRWVMAIAAYAPGRVADVQLQVQQDNLSWQKLKPFANEVSLLVLNPSFRKLKPPEINFAELSGSVENHSSFTFGRVEVQAVLYDTLGRIVAVGQTVLEGFSPGATAPFLIAWPTPFQGEVARFDVTSHTNLLSDTNFVQQYKE